MRRLLALPSLVLLASCVAKPLSRPVAPPAAPVAALPAAPPRQDWRDVALTPGTWTWRGLAGVRSLARFGVPGGAAVFAVRCDPATRTVVMSRAGTIAAPSSMTFTTSFGPFALAAVAGGGQPEAIVASLPAQDRRLDKLAFSRGRFLVDLPGQERLVLPAWPEVARVVEDCRS